MRVWVLKRRKLKNSLRFSFLLLVTRWFADRLNLVLCYKNWFDITGFDVTFVDNLIKQDEMYIPALKKKCRYFIIMISGLSDFSLEFLDYYFYRL